MASLLDSQLLAIEYSRRFASAMLEAIPLEQYCHQPFDGANHALWTTGHLAAADCFFMSLIGGPADARFEQLKDKFFIGSKPAGELSAYPPVEEVRRWFEEARANLTAYYRSMSEEELAAPMPEQWARIAANRGSLIARIAVHESAHAGQLTVVRKSLGLAPVFA